MGAFGRRLVQMERRLTATCHTTHHAACSVQRMSDLPRTTRSVQHAPCSIQQTTWSTQQPMCNMQYRNMPHTGTTAARRLSRTDSTASRTIGSALSTTPPTRMRSSDETKLSRLSSSALFHYGPCGSIVACRPEGALFAPFSVCVPSELMCHSLEAAYVNTQKPLAADAY